MNVYGCGSCINTILSSTIGKVALFLWSVALYYHLLNGIRHLVWDIGYGFEIETVNRSGQLTILGTIVLTAITWTFFV